MDSPETSRSRDIGEEEEEVVTLVRQQESVEESQRISGQNPSTFPTLGAMHNGRVHTAHTMNVNIEHFSIAHLQAQQRNTINHYYQPVEARSLI